MLSCWAVLLLVGGRAVAAAPTTQSTTSRSYEQVVASAVQAYNQQQKPEFAFRLLEAEPQEGWDPSAKTTQSLKFSIKETTCRSSEKTDASQCDYKPDGIDRDCSGFYFADQSPPTTTVQCEDVNKVMNRITRGRWRKIWNTTKKVVGGIFRFVS